MLGEGDRRKAVVEGYVTFPFAPCAEGELASGDDEVYVYAYCPEMEEGVLSAAAWRRMGCVTLVLPERWQGKEVHFYGFAVDYEGHASTTTYLGMLAATPSVETQQAASQHNSQRVVDNNLWHESCNQNNSSNFAPRIFMQWKQT